MEQTSVQKLARVLRVMVLAVFVCNIIVLFFVPALAAMLAENRWDGQTMERLLNGGERGVLAEFHPPYVESLHLDDGCGGGGAVLAGADGVFALCGVCTAIILWQGRRVLDTILKGSPFVMNNAKSLKTAAMCCFLISGAALARLVWGFAYYRSIMPMLTYNALFVPIFLMGGLLFMVMSALFRQAVELKAENDLTI